MMKRSLLAALLLSGIIFVSTAQESGMWLGGTLSLSGQENNNQTQTGITLMPELGFNTAGAWAFGGSVGYSASKTVQAGTGNIQRTNSTSIVPFARYTFGEIAGFRVFGQGELPVVFSGGEYYDGSAMESSTSFGFRVRPGIAYHFNERWGFNMLMPSVLNFTNNSSGTSSWGLGVNDGYTIQSYLLSTSIGFIFMF